jgi:hypothetical protein
MQKGFDRCIHYSFSKKFIVFGDDLQGGAEAGLQLISETVKNVYQLLVFQKCIVFGADLRRGTAGGRGWGCS